MATRPKDPIQDLHCKLTHKEELIRKWQAAAEACDPSDAVGRATQRYCLGLARAAQEKQKQLLAKLARIGGNAENAGGGR